MHHQRVLKQENPYFSTFYFFINGIQISIFIESTMTAELFISLIILKENISYIHLCLHIKKNLSL